MKSYDIISLPHEYNKIAKPLHKKNTPFIIAKVGRYIRFTVGVKCEEVRVIQTRYNTEMLHKSYNDCDSAYEYCSKCQWKYFDIHNQEWELKILCS